MKIIFNKYDILNRPYKISLLRPTVRRREYISMIKNINYITFFLFLNKAKLLHFI